MSLETRVMRDELQVCKYSSTNGLIRCGAKGTKNVSRLSAWTRDAESSSLICEEFVLNIYPYLIQVSSQRP